MRQNASRHVENAIDIDPEHAMPVVDRQIQKGAAPTNSCIVDWNVDPAEAAEGVGGQLRHVFDIRDVRGLDQAAVAPQALPDLRQFGVPATTQYDGGSLGVKTPRRRGANARTGARYDDYFSTEPRKAHAFSLPMIESQARRRASFRGRSASDGGKLGSFVFRIIRHYPASQSD
jgi:hypothetical protein